MNAIKNPLDLYILLIQFIHTSIQMHETYKKCDISVIKEEALVLHMGRINRLVRRQNRVYVFLG